MGGRKGGREEGRKGGRKRGREGGREGGRKGGREKDSNNMQEHIHFILLHHLFKVRHYLIEIPYSSPVSSELSEWRCTKKRHLYL